MNELNNEYNLTNFSSDKIIALVIEALALNSGKETNNASKGCNCERIRRNCLVEVGAAAIAGH